MQKATTSRSSADSKRDSSTSPEFPSEGYQIFGKVLRNIKGDSRISENEYVQFCNVLSEIFSEVFPDFKKRIFAEHCQSVVTK